MDEDQPTDDPESWKADAHVDHNSPPEILDDPSWVFSSLVSPSLPFRLLDI